MEQIIKGIKELLMSQKCDEGRNLYQITKESIITLGDESTNIDLIFCEWAKEDDALERYEKIIRALLDYAIKAMESELSWAQLVSNELCIVYSSKTNDLFYIQISDGHVHLHLHYSGQY